MRLAAVINARDTIIHHLPKGGVGMEIGVWKGEFSAKLLAGTRPRLLHLVDPWKVAEDPQHKIAMYGAARVTQAEMDVIHEQVAKRFSANPEVKLHRATSTGVLGGMADESLDYVYVDGDHSYEGALADLRAALPKIKTGGFICGDDYALGNWWADGVVRALHEFLAGGGVIIELLIGTQFLLRKR